MMSKNLFRRLLRIFQFSKINKIFILNKIYQLFMINYNINIFQNIKLFIKQVLLYILIFL